MFSLVYAPIAGVPRGLPFYGFMFPYACWRFDSMEVCARVFMMKPLYFSSCEAFYWLNEHFHLENKHLACLSFFFRVWCGTVNMWQAFFRRRFVLGVVFVFLFMWLRGSVQVNRVTFYRPSLKIGGVCSGDMTRRYFREIGIRIPEPWFICLVALCFQIPSIPGAACSHGTYFCLQFCWPRLVVPRLTLPGWAPMPPIALIFMCLV